METPLRVTVVIPTIDEPQITDVIASILNTCDPADIAGVIAVYGRQTPPEHAAFLQSLQNRFPQISVSALLQPGFGPGDAAFAGCAAAKGTHAVILGADMENDPNDISRMIALAKTDPARIIKASRRLKKETFADYPKVKKVFNVLFQWMMRTAFSSKQTDITYAYQLTPMKYLREYDFLPDHGAFAIELALLPEIYGVPYTEIPSAVSRRASGRSHTDLKYYFGYLFTAIRIYRKKRRLRK